MTLLALKAAGDWRYDDRTHNYVDTRTGKFLDASARLGLRDEVTARQKERMAATTRDLIAGKLTPAEWERRMRGHIQSVQIMQYAFGRGGRAALTDSDKAAIGANVQGQFGYLAGFRADVEAGRLSDAQILARAGLYANANSAAYEQGWTAAFGMPALPTYPGAGATVCLTNCRCHLDIVELENGWSVYWKLGGGEPCDDCRGYAATWNPYRVEKAA